jgi:hypothetical protein
MNNWMLRPLWRSLQTLTTARRLSRKTIWPQDTASMAGREKNEDALELDFGDMTASFLASPNYSLVSRPKLSSTILGFN